MDPLTHRPSVVAQRIVQLLDDNKTDIGSDLTPKLVRYGDQNVHAAVPALYVEPAQLDRELHGVPFQMDNTFAVALLLYFTSDQGVESIQRRCDVLAEDIAEFLNKRSLPELHGGDRLGGIVTSGFVSRYEFGFRVLTDRTMRCNRLIWTGYSVTNVAEGLV